MPRIGEQRERVGQHPIGRLNRHKPNIQCHPHAESEIEIGRYMTVVVVVPVTVIVMIIVVMMVRVGVRLMIRLGHGQAHKGSAPTDGGGRWCDGV